jgi:hypothetical protein
VASSNRRKIYKCTDPRDGSVRYVGKTRKDLQVRLKQHLIQRDTNLVKRAWIDELAALGLQPLISLIEETPEFKDSISAIYAEQRETYWIEYYLSRNEPLTNQQKVVTNIRREKTRRLWQ